MDSKGKFGQGWLIPRERALQYVQKSTPAAAKRDLENYRKPFRLLMGNNPRSALAHMQAYHQKPMTFMDFIDWTRTFAWLCPLEGPTELTDLLLTCMEVPQERRGRMVLHRCHCENYMHYQICGHVVLFHMQQPKDKRYWDQLPRSLCHAVKVRHVNKSVKQSDGPGAKKRKIIPGQALQRD